MHNQQTKEDFHSCAIKIFAPSLLCLYCFQYIVRVHINQFNPLCTTKNYRMKNILLSVNNSCTVNVLDIIIVTKITVYYKAKKPKPCFHFIIQYLECISSTFRAIITFLDSRKYKTIQLRRHAIHDANFFLPHTLKT